MKQVEHTTQIKIPFFDVDRLDIVWHGHYVKYFEIARCALLDKLGYNYNTMKETGYAWPVVELKVKFVRPAIFGQLVNVQAILVEYENRLKINYLISDHKSAEKLTQGSTTQLAIDIETNELQFVSPQLLQQKVQDYLHA